ncbi:hypothetical protein ABI59_13860 [Acidobacteria bacterium Mor1]|nr:hypothetical protein ABI59_13860 [Acidobacteria bacterium Mor1]
MRRTLLLLILASLVLTGCGGDEEEGGRPGGPGGRGRGGPPMGAMQSAGAAVPVEVQSVQRRDIHAYIETNGTLEAENEVDVVARVAGPIVSIKVEEGMRVNSGQLLAQIDQAEYRADLEVARVNLQETRQAFERAQKLRTDQLISTEEYEASRAAFESAQAQFDGNELRLDFTQVRAPFSGLIITRYVDPGQTVSGNEMLFRISDFTPLLCPIQVPERELSKLRTGQAAYLEVEAWADERFDARVQRVSPVVDAETGTIKVTLEVNARGKLRPGMFARVFLETDIREDTLVIPRAALSLESIGDTVYVLTGEDTASRREVELGFREGDYVEILSGVSAGEAVVTVGQDGLSDGTPLKVLRRDGADTAGGAGARADRGAEPQLDEERLQRMRARMKERGMSDEEIDARIKQFTGGGGGPGARGGAEGERAAGQGPPEGGPPGGRPGGRGGRPDFANMTEEQLEAVKERMRSRGLTDEQIEERIERMRSGGGRPGRSVEGSGSAGGTAP